MILAINPKNPQLRLVRKVIEVLEREGSSGTPPTLSMEWVVISSTRRRSGRFID